MNKAISPCGQLVKQSDPDRYLASLFAPSDTWPALWATLAFNNEIAKTREIVSETRLGHIRLQWWREELEKIYHGKPHESHDVLLALAKAIKQYNLPQYLFESLLYAREFDLEDVIPSSMDGLLNYADFTTTPLFKLLLIITGSDPDLEPVYPVAINYALAGLIRAVPFHAGQGRCYLPDDLLTANNVQLASLYKGTPENGICTVIQEIHTHIVSDVKTDNRILKALHILSCLYAQKIKKSGYDPFNTRLPRPLMLKELRVALSTFFL